MGVPDAQWGEAVKAVCVLENGQACTAGKQIDFVAGRTARYKKPRCVDFVDERPRTADGRLDRIKVKDLFGNAE